MGRSVLVRPLCRHRVVHGEDRVLTLHRHPTVPDEVALLTVGRWWLRFQFDWQRFLVGWAGAFHLLIAFTLTFAPYEQIYNAGTAPVYEIAPRYVWAALFLLAGLFALLLLRRQTTLMQCLTWFTVLPLGGAWLTAFVLAVIAGRGSAIGVVVWPFLYVPWALAGLRIALGKR